MKKALAFLLITGLTWITFACGEEEEDEPIPCAKPTEEQLEQWQQDQTSDDHVDAGGCLLADQVVVVQQQQDQTPTTVGDDDDDDSAATPTPTPTPDPPDGVYIAYIKNDGGYKLHVANNESGSWVDEEVGSANMSFVSMAVDSNAKVHVVYAGSSSWKVDYATNESGAWVSSLVANGFYPAIAVDSTDKPRVAFQNYTTTNLDIGSYNGSSWTIGEAATAQVAPPTDYVGAANIDIAIGSDDLAQVVFSDKDAGAKGDLQYVKETSPGNYSASTISDDGGSYWDSYNSSIILDGSNVPHIAYYDHVSSTVKHVTGSPGSWTISDIGHGSTYKSIGLDSGGDVYIAYYYRFGGYNIYMADNSTGSFLKSGVNASSNSNKASVSMVIDGNDKKHVCFYDSSAGKLYYGTDASGSWVATEIAATVNTNGAYCSIGKAGVKGRNNRP